MSGVGFMSQAQSFFKNNQRKKKRLFDTLERYVKTSKDHVKVDKKATPEQLNRIRQQIRKEKKVLQKLSFILLLSLLFCLFSLNLTSLKKTNIYDESMA